MGTGRACEHGMSLSYILRMMPKYDLEFVSRKASASPATGYSKVHKVEQEKIVNKAFEI